LDDTFVTIGAALEAAQEQFGSAIIAADVFPTSKKVALAFVDTEEAMRASGTGLHVGDMTLDLTFYAKRRYNPCKLTVSNTNCNNPTRTVRALLDAFSEYGQVIDVTPRFWTNTTFHTGAWHVTIMPHSTTPPPELVPILGQDAYVDIPRIRRVCRYCKTVEHTNKSCRAGQLAKRQAEETLARYRATIPDASDTASDEDVAEPSSSDHVMTADNAVDPPAASLPDDSARADSQVFSTVPLTPTELLKISGAATAASTFFSVPGKDTYVLPEDSASNVDRSPAPQPLHTTTTTIFSVVEPSNEEDRSPTPRKEPHGSPHTDSSMDMDQVSMVSVAATVIPPSSSTPLI
jgi:hypothetical protein